MRHKFVWIVLLALVPLLGCAGKARHTAVIVDQTVAQVVFALDDAEYQACHQTQTLPVDTCAKLDPVIKQALLDVKALTAALQLAPKDGPLPKSLPALLKSLNDVGAVIDALGGGPQFAGLAAKARAADAAVVNLLTQFAGGQ
jgi:hypothetical protein